MCSSDPGPGSSSPATPVTGAEPSLKTPAAPTPSRAISNDAQRQEELTKHMKSPRGTGFQTKRVATKPPVKPAPASTVQTKDKSPAKKDFPIPAEKSTPLEDNPLNDF